MHDQKLNIYIYILREIYPFQCWEAISILINVKPKSLQVSLCVNITNNPMPSILNHNLDLHATSLRLHIIFIYVKFKTIIS